MVRSGGWIPMLGFSGLELIFTHQKGEVHENTKQDGYREADQ